MSSEHGTGVSPIFNSVSTVITYPWKKLLKNETFCARILIIPPAIFILFLCICYAISSLLQLRLDNYWCDDQVTLSEIREHSMKEGLSGGIYDQCWDISAIRNNELLWRRQSYGYSWVFNAQNISRSIPLFIVAVFLAILIIYYAVQLIMDIKKYRKGRLFIKIKKERDQNKLSCFKKCLIMYIKWSSRTFGVDTGKWID